MKKTIFLFLGLIMIAQSVFSLTINCTAGGLSAAIINGGGSLSTTTDLTITGSIDARDVKLMRDKMPLLSVIDISGVAISEYIGTAGTNAPASTASATYPANVMPQNSFYNGVYTSTDILKSIVLPASITSIGGSAFFLNTGLTRITIPNSVVSIEGSAFSGCYGLTQVSMGTGVATIMSFAFNECLNLTNMIVPNSVVSIGNWAFQNCTKLTSLCIGSGIKTLGNYSFNNCSGLKTIYCLSPNPPILGLNCFQSVSQVIDVFVPSDEAVIEYKANNSNVGWGMFFSGSIIKKGAPSSIINLTNSQIKAYPYQSSILIDGTVMGETVFVYTLGGVQLQSIKSQGERLSIPVKCKGVYFVRTQDKTVKVLM